MQLAIPLIGGLEYVDAVFQTIKDSDFLQYTIVGMNCLLYTSPSPRDRG